MNRVTAPPADLAATRDALHRLAVYAVGPWRRARTGRVGLRVTPGGFGTPPGEGDGARVRVTPDGVVVEDGRGGAATHPFTTLGGMARVLGVVPDGAGMGHDLPPRGDLDAPLAVDPAAVRWMAAWFAFGQAVLEGFVARADPADTPAEIQLWPEHFDLATDAGVDPWRMGAGFSPGDAAHPAPYLYAQPWTVPDPADPFWDAPHHRYRTLPAADLAAADDPVSAALDFLATGRAHVRETIGGAR